MAIGTPTTVASDMLIGVDPPVAIGTYNANFVPITGAVLNVGASGLQNASGGTAYANPALYNATFPNDQWAQLTITNVTTSGPTLGVVLRGTVGTGAGSGYYMLVSKTTVVVNKITNGALTTQLLSLPVTVLAGDVYRFTVIGTLLTVERNGTTIWRGYDLTFTSGQAGVCGVYLAGTFYANNWSAGSVAYQALTPGFLPTPLSISLAGATNGTWRTVTLTCDNGGASGPPPGITTGVILNWASTSSTTVMTRVSSLDTVITTPPVGNAAAASSQGWIHTGVVLNTGVSPQTVSFDINLSTVTGYQLYLVGYYGPEAVFLVPSVAITVPTTFPSAVNLAPNVPAAAVAIFASLWGDTTRIVPHGDADIVNWHPTGLNSQSVICGVTGSQIDLTANTGTTPVLYLRGYMRAGFTWRTPPTVVTPGTTGSFQTLAQAGGYSAVPSGFVYEVNGTALVSLTSQWPSGGVPKPNIQMIPANGNVIGVASGPAPVANIAAGAVLAEQGYFVPVPITTAPTGTTKAYLAVRTTSQA